ncbi:MAG: DUF624 domain-containing protein [Lachnospiraceae bacterium]|jgi:uncharacterized membrane protein YesL|nr:DUF624 domain-containing protein [Lachnospiraceae bacterium]
MASGIFNWENPVWKYLGRLADAILLTLLWAVFSLPVITIGASTTALFYCALKIVKGEEGYLIKQFVKSFRANLLQGTIIWMLCLGMGGALAWNLWFFHAQESSMAKVISIMLYVFAYLFLMVLHYVFAVLARFDSSTGNIFGMAFYLSVKNFGWTLLMITISGCVAAISIFVFSGMLAIGVGLAALLDSWMLHPVFEQYLASRDKTLTETSSPGA